MAGLDPATYEQKRPGAIPAFFFLRHCEPTGRAYARPMTGSAEQSIVIEALWIASSLRSSQ
jgi:hypothetical protein